MTQLQLRLLGRLEVVLGSTPITGFESNKVRALLAYLAVESDQPQRREALAALLWPDWPQKSAMNNLRYALADLRMQNFKTPGTAAKAVAMIRSELLKAREYMKRRSSKDQEKRPATDLRMEMLSGVLRGERPVLFSVQTVSSIMTALRLQREFNFRMIIDGAAEAPLVLEEIKKAGVAVILHPTMEAPYGDMNSASFETAAILKKAGVPFAIQSGYESYVPKTRVLLFEAAIAAANGLAFADALASVTSSPARILGVEKRVGSLEPGKDADVVVFEGDPFEYTSHVCTVIVQRRGHEREVQMN